MLTLTHEEALRFVDKIRLVSETGCWEWTGGRTHGNSTSATDKGGYGKFYLRGRTRLAHCVMYEAARGPLQGTVDHLCRNRACVRSRCFEDVPIGVNVLRGVGVCAENARKATCLRGHLYTPENTGTQKGTGRFCKTCRREDYKRYRRRQKAGLV